MPLVNGRTKYSESVFTLFSEKTNSVFVEIELPELHKYKKLISRICCIVLFIPSIWVESWYARKAIFKKLETLNENDIIVIDHFQFWWLALSRTLKKSLAKVVLVSHNLEVENKRSYYRYGYFPINIIALFESIGLNFWERVTSKNADAIICINSEEIKTYQSWLNTDSVFLVYPYVDKNLEIQKNKTLTEKEIVLLVGSYGYKAKELNADWLLDIYQTMTDRLPPNHELQIIGRGASKKLIAKAEKSSFVTYIGEVDSLEKWYSDATAAVVPERLGGGFKLKILEAIGFDVPLIIHKQALMGSGFEEGIDCLSFTDGDDLLGAYEILKSSPETSNRLREKAIKKVNTLFNKELALKRVETLLLALR